MRFPAFFLIPLILSLSSSAALQDSLIAWYPFNGNPNDASGNGNNGTANSITFVPDRFGNSNSAANFSYTNSYIDVHSSNSLNFPNTVSISLWVNKRTQRQEYTGILCKGRDNGENFYVGYSEVNKYYYAGINNGGSWHSFGTVSTFPDTGRWQHLVAVISASTTPTIYINGQIYQGEWKNGASPWVLSSLPTTDSSMRIGRGSDGVGGTLECFNGAIDDIRIYSRTLSAEEITALYQEGSARFLSAVASNSPSPNVLLSFDKPVDTFTVTSQNINSIFHLSGGHSWLSGFGSIGSAVWNPESTMLLVTLSSTVSPPTIAIGDTISFTIGSGSAVLTGVLTSVHNDYNLGDAGSISIRASKDKVIFSVRPATIGNARIRIQNLSGKSIADFSTSQTRIWNSRGYSAGIYFAQIYSGKSLIRTIPFLLNQ
jgi:Concanavalin A-like lectin/glucanases superfamily